MAGFPRTGCSVIVRNGDRVLLIKRGKEPYKGCWSLPGGAQELGEPLEDCAKRELFEETGLRVSSLTYLTTRDRITRDTNGQITHHYVLSTFLAENVSGTACAGDDAMEVERFTLEEIDMLDTTPETPTFIREMLTPLR